MKPVNKGKPVLSLANHKQAKPELISRMGSFCSYCEAAGKPQDIDVEHIYPQEAHPELAAQWRNFLLACSTCNTYKRLHLGDGRQAGMLRRFLWPHLDNTFKAFQYHPDGRVTVADALPPQTKPLAAATQEMVGLIRSPAVAREYHDRGIAYDGVRRRSEVWLIAQRARVVYQQNPTAEQMASLLDNAKANGYFSVWMTVFEGMPQVRTQLIIAFDAAPACFSLGTTQAQPRGRV